MWEESKENFQLILLNAAVIIGAYFLNWLWDFGVDYVITNVLGQKNEIMIGILNIVFNYFCGGILNIINLGITAYTLWNIYNWLHYYLSYRATGMQELIGKFVGTIMGAGLLVIILLGVVISYIKLPVLFENVITMLVLMIAIDLLLEIGRAHV